MGNIYHFLLVLIVISAVGTGILGYMAWQRRATPGARILAAMLFAVSWWAWTYMAEILWPDLPGKIFWARCKYFAIIPIPWLLLGFTLQYTRHDRWLQRKYILPVLVIPLLSLVAVWTDSYHHLFYTSLQVIIHYGRPLLETTHGSWFWVHTAYSYIGLLLGVFFLASSAYHSTKTYKSQQWMLLLAALAPWLANAITLFGKSHEIGLDLTPLAFTITGGACYVAVFHMHLLDITPIARRLVVENMQDGMLVLNLEGRVLDINPVLEHWLEKTPDQVIWHPLADLLPQPVVTQLTAGWNVSNVIEVETCFRNQAQTIEVHSSLIYDIHEQAVGRVLLLRDITDRKKYETSLWQTKELLERVFNSINLLVVYLDQDLKIIRANRAFGELAGRDPELLVGQLLFELFPDLDREAIFREVLATGQEYSLYGDPYNRTAGQASQTTFWDWSVQPVNSAQGKIEGLVLTMINVSARQIAEEERRQMDARFHTLVESMNDVVYTLDLEGCYTGFYGRWLKQFDLLEKLLHRPVPVDLLGEAGAQVHLEANKSALQGKEAVYEWRIFTSHGEKVFQNSLSPILDNGVVKGAVGVGRDITGLKELERELEDAKALMEQAFEQSPTPIVLLRSPGGEIEMFNSACQESLKMGDPKQMLGIPLTEAPLAWQIADTDGQPLPQERWPFCVALRGEAQHNAEFQIRFEDGSVRWVITSAAPIYNKAGRQIAALVVFVDITERKQIEQAEREQRLLAEAFRDTAAILNSTIQLDNVLNLILTNIERVVPLDAAHVVLLNEDGEIRRVRYRGYAAEEQQAALALSQQVAGLPHWSDNPERPPALILSDIQAETEWAEHAQFKSLRAFLNVPIRFKNQPMGLLTLASTVPDFFNPDHAARLQVFVDQAAIAIENAYLYSEVQHLTLTDELTHAYNYRGLIDLGQREFDRARRFNRPLSLLFFDVDNFRDFNNLYTHAVGHQVLQAIAKFTRGCVRGVDVLARFGGEEFIVLLPETDLKSAMEVADRLRHSVEQAEVLTRFGRLHVTISVGAAELSDDISSLSGLIERANQAEHRSKAEGRNRVSAFVMPGKPYWTSQYLGNDSSFD